MTRRNWFERLQKWTNFFGRKTDRDLGPESGTSSRAEKWPKILGRKTAPDFEPKNGPRSWARKWPKIRVRKMAPALSCIIDWVRNRHTILDQRTAQDLGPERSLRFWAATRTQILGRKTAQDLEPENGPRSWAEKRHQILVRKAAQDLEPENGPRSWAGKRPQILVRKAAQDLAPFSDPPERLFRASTAACQRAEEMNCAVNRGSSSGLELPTYTPQPSARNQHTRDPTPATLGIKTSHTEALLATYAWPQVSNIRWLSRPDASTTSTPKRRASTHHLILGATPIALQL